MLDLIVFLPACFAMNLTFGPNNLLAMTHGAREGVGFAFMASLCRLAVFIPLIGASALGLGVLLSASATAFTVVKVVGAAYLIWIGLRLLKSSPDASELSAPVGSASLRNAMRSEAMVAVSNPKAILIFAAFFPQFVDPANYWQSYALVGGLFLLLEAVAIVIYAAAGRFARKFAAHRLHWFQRVSGGGMILFGVLLLLAKAPGRATA